MSGRGRDFGQPASVAPSIQTREKNQGSSRRKIFPSRSVASLAACLPD